MNKLHFSINTEEHLITLSNIKMNQNGFSYNSINFSKVDDNTVEVSYNKQTPENDRSGIDCNLTWALNDIIKVLNEESKPGNNPYDEAYVMFEFEL